VMVLATRLDGGLGAWSHAARFTAGLVGYLARLPHGELRSLVEAADPAPLRALGRLAPATLAVGLRQAGDAAALDIRNVSPALAFFVSVAVEGGGGAGVEYSDNFVWLLPGESRTIRITAAATPVAQAARGPLALRVGGWNVAPWRVPGTAEVREGRIVVRAP